MCGRTARTVRRGGRPGIQPVFLTPIGLPEAEGLRAITLSAAEILGISDQLGSLTPGKLANLVISDGPPLQQTSQIKGVFIEGNPFAPESRQTRFYQRYRRRLHEVQKKNGKPSSAGTK